MLGIIFICSIFLLGIYFVGSEQPTKLNILFASSLGIFVLFTIYLSINQIDKLNKENTELLTYMVNKNCLNENIIKKYKNDIINIKTKIYKEKLEKELK